VPVVTFCFLARSVSVKMPLLVGMGVPVCMSVPMGMVMDGSIFMLVLVSVVVGVRVSVLEGHGIVFFLDGSRNAPSAHIR